MKLSIIIPMFNNEDRIIRCLESIEKRKDVELILIDDKSKDNTFNIAADWTRKNSKFFGKAVIIKNKQNLGVGLTMNKGYDKASGEYIMTLCDDDYLIAPLSDMFKFLDGTDMVYYNLEINNGDVWRLNEETKKRLVGATKFYSKKIIGNTRRTEKRLYGDADFYFEILKKNPTEKFTDITFYHYDFPRSESLIGRAIKEANSNT